MGVHGVFEIICETWHSHPELCVKVLQSFLDLLQGQGPSGLRYKPKENHWLVCMYIVMCNICIIQKLFHDRCSK